MSPFESHPAAGSVKTRRSSCIVGGATKKRPLFFRFFLGGCLPAAFLVGNVCVCWASQENTMFFTKKLTRNHQLIQKKLYFVGRHIHMKLSQPNASEITAKHLVMSIFKNQTACLLFPPLLLCRSPHPICLKRNSLTCGISFFLGGTNDELGMYCNVLKCTLLLIPNKQNNIYIYIHILEVPLESCVS